MIVVTLAFIALVWQRRWMTDDALIDVRVARQILAGNGPVFNLFERTEPNTSALWPWLLALAGLVTRANLEWLALALGGSLAVLALVIAMDATRRWLRSRGSSARLAPCGAFVLIGAFPFWDFATSGLETGLTLAWLAAIWWLLVTLRDRRHVATAIAFGLGPLVRPDLALVSAVFLVAGWLLVRPARRRTLALAGYAIALPLGYEIFRAGYYGSLVPLPALAKSAGKSAWLHGLGYVWHFIEHCWLWVPLAALAVLAGLAIARKTLATRDRIIAIAPVAAAGALTIFVVRVGGDFMFARMMLAPMFLLILPAMLVPIRTPALAVVAGWALIIAASVRTYHGTDVGFDWYSDWDERQSYVRMTLDDHPVDAAAYVRRSLGADVYRRASNAGVQHRMYWDHDGSTMHVDPTLDTPVVIVADQLGTAGAIAPLDGEVADRYGLADPIGARITPTFPGRTGHEKQLPWAWVLAEYGDPAFDVMRSDPDRTSPEGIAAARRVMTCEPVAELLASVREPLTAGRFWDNLVGAFGRTRLVIPSDPAEAVRELCP